MVTSCIDRLEPALEPLSTQRPSARWLPPEERQRLGLQALAGRQPVAELASSSGVSRKFVYRQAQTAARALDAAFADPQPDAAPLFHVPVTKSWLRQFILAQLLIGHTSLRGVTEILRDVFGFSLSIGTVHNVVQEAIVEAKALNRTEQLGGVRVGLHDEIFQAGHPVLVGLDAGSTYCYLLTPAEHRDETTWGVHLLELQERGLAPGYTVADAGQGLRAGQAAAWPGTPCHGDVFHAERELGQLACYLEHRAAGARSALEALEAKMLRACAHGQGNTLSKPLALARQAATQSLALAQDVRVLSDWLQHDILAVAGPAPATRQELFDFLVAELQAREQLCPHRIAPVRRFLQNQRDHLLAFARSLALRLQEIAREYALPVASLYAFCELQNLDQNQPLYWQRQAALRSQLGTRYHAATSAVQEALHQTVRASSLVENLNSRLRNYFFLRRQIGDDYLVLLRFFLNHRRFLRSENPERAGKSPAELLTGRPHPHWLEMLGFVRFTLN